MKNKIHPQYYDNAVVTCSCGNTFTTGSTKKQIHVEICAQCHPFFTGEMKYIDTLGRVERFQKRQAAVSGKKYVSKKQRKLIAKELQDKDDGQPKTLKEMLKKKAQPKKKTT